MSKTQQQQDGQDAQTKTENATDGLSIAWAGAYRYVVHSPVEDDQRGNEYRVDLTKVGTHDPTCTCEHGQNKAGTTETCRHVMAAIDAQPATFDLDRFTVEQLANFFVTAQDTLTDVQGTAAYAAGQPSRSSEDSDSDGATDADSESSDEPSPITTEGISASDPQSQLVDEVLGWLDAASEFNGDIDPAIVSAEWARMDHAAHEGEGVHIEMAPWNAGAAYWDSEESEWTDQEGYNEAAEAVRDLLSNQDEIVYVGDPHYVNFIPEDDVTEVVG